MIQNMPDISIQSFDYQLPDSHIALFPADQRDGSRLLVYKEPQIKHTIFKDFPNLLPINSMLICNNTKVIPARVFIQKPSGTTIELFLLKPIENNIATQLIMEQQGESSWECLIGNKKRWKLGEILRKELVSLNESIDLTFEWIDRETNQVRIRWNGDYTFAALLDIIGQMPLPPYMDRESEASDQDRYQTIFSNVLGAVAAPTASLHFTPEIFDALHQKGIKESYLTLHVGAGTFLPVKEGEVRNHPMHREQLIFTKEFIQQIIAHTGPFVPIGTTAMRAMESLYWSGVWLLEEREVPESGLVIPKEFAYHIRKSFTTIEALDALILYLEKTNQESWIAQTELLIMPTYKFRFCDALVTNFHQPKSTLLVLVSALIGDAWKEIYAEAVEKNYRFLSYGDACLFFKKSL
jgi:S-adenosylmethionine:tRNA ribosyltransferase-isomerase